MRQSIRIAATSFILAAGMATTASADIVYLTSGRTLSVKAHRVEGESMVLTLRGGGEVTCERSLIDRIVPDEVPYPEPEAATSALQAAVSAIDPALLEKTPYGDIIATMSEAHGVDPMLVEIGAERRGPVAVRGGIAGLGAGAETHRRVSRPTER